METYIIQCHMYLMLFFLLLQSVGWSALFYAAKDGHLEIARLLVSAGANTLLRDQVLMMLPGIDT